MIATNKLKLVTAVLAAVGLLAGGGVGLVKAADPPAAKAQIGPTLDDKQFLTKSCETLRGSAPTPAEMAYFLDDKDAGKRKKVVGWLTEPEASAVLFFKPMLDKDMEFVAEARAEKFRRLNLNATDPPKSVENVPHHQLNLKMTEKPKAVEGADTELVLLWDETKANPTADFLYEVTETTLYDANAEADTDEAFLARVIESARGGKPTRIEKEYFLADKEAKKRERLLDQLLKDPAVAKKVGPEWKQTMLNPPVKYTFVVYADVGTPWADKLIDDLLAKKKTDEQILEALTLAATGRLPTDTEKKLVAAVVSKAKVKKAGWQEVAGTLAGTDEAKTHADRLKPQVNVRVRMSEFQPLKLEVQSTPTKPAEKK